MGAPFTAIRLSLFCCFTPHEAILPISSLFLYVSMYFFFHSLTRTHTSEKKASAHPAIGSHRRAISGFRLLTDTLLSTNTSGRNVRYVPLIIENNIFGERERDYFWFWRDTVPSVESNQIASAPETFIFEGNGRSHRNNKI